MLNICQIFALNHNLKFSTKRDPYKSKTKCIHFSCKKIDLAINKLNGDDHPWVEHASRGGFKLVGALGITKCGGPPNKVFSLVPITCFESFRVLVLLQIGEHSVLTLIKGIRFGRKSHILLSLIF